MKAVLISIQPYWVFLIIAKAMGWNIDKEKTVEVRKSRPKAENWNKVAKIYCSKDKKSFAKIPKEYQLFMKQLLGKVIGEFVCDTIFNLDEASLFAGMTEINKSVIEEFSCVDIDDLLQYKGGKSEIYGWSITNLVIYEKPKELSEFYKYTEYDDSNNDIRPCRFCVHNKYDFSEMCEYCEIDFDGEHCIHLQMRRPPQSWCYVEERRENDAQSKNN